MEEGVSSSSKAGCLYEAYLAACMSCATSETGWAWLVAWAVDSISDCTPNNNYKQRLCCSTAGKQDSLSISFVDPLEQDSDNSESCQVQCPCEFVAQTLCSKTGANRANRASQADLMAWLATVQASSSHLHSKSCCLPSQPFRLCIAEANDAASSMLMMTTPAKLAFPLLQSSTWLENVKQPGMYL